MAASFLAIFIWGSIDSLLGAILPDLVARVHLTDARAGAISLLNGVGLVAASLCAGPVIDRFGKKSVFLPALVVIALSLAGLGWAASFTEICALALTLGLGGSMVVTAAQSLVSDLNPAERTAALNLLNFFFGLGAFVTPLARTWLERLGGLAGTTMILAVICLGVFGFDWTTRFPEPAHAAHKRRGPILAEPLFWLPTLIVFLYVGVETSVWYWQVVYWVREFGAAVSHARLGVSLFAAAIMAGRLMSRWVLRFISSRALLLWGTGGSVAGLCGMRVASDFRLSVSLLILAGLFMAVVFPTAIGVVGSRFPEASGTPIALTVTAGWLGAMVVRPVIGFTAGLRGLGPAYWIVVAGAALMLLLNVALASVDRATSRRQAAQEAIVVP